MNAERQKEMMKEAKKEKVWHCIIKVIALMANEDHDDDDDEDRHNHHRHHPVCNL